jgi:hypothetical protein
MKTEKKTLITAVLAIGMIAASGTATAATSVSAFPAPAAFVMPTHDGGGGGGTGGAGTGSGGSGSTGSGSTGTGSGGSGSGTTTGSDTTTGSSSTTITGNYAQSYTGRGNNGCPFTPGDLGCRGELMSGGQVVCSPC